MRISRALALAGVDSRRKCEQHVSNGAIRLNGEVVRDLGRQVDIDADVLEFRGRVVHFERYVYFLLNKPVGYTTTAQDVHAKKTVYQILPKELVPRTRQAGANKVRVFPVGRLDRDSSGLLLFTNDGELSNRLLHPRYRVGKWYEVRLDRAFDPRDGKKLLTGVRLREGRAKALDVKMISKRMMRLMISDGKNREVRRLYEAIGYEVVSLVRIAMGPLKLGRLRLGEGRYLSKSEVQQLKDLTHR